MITMIGAGTGQVLKQFEDIGLAEDTLIIFTFDYFDWMGDPELMLGSLLQSQDIIRFQFNWQNSRPASQGLTNTGMASSINGVPTVGVPACIQLNYGIQRRNPHDCPPPKAVLVEEDGQRTVTGLRCEPIALDRSLPKTNGIIPK